MTWLERAYEEREPALILAKISALLDPRRSAPLPGPDPPHRVPRGLSDVRLRRTQAGVEWMTQRRPGGLTQAVFYPSRLSRGVVVEPALNGLEAPPGRLA